jgi:hypothetical protein
MEDDVGDPYVTPERFKTMGFGVDLDDVEDFELRSVLRRASDRVNAICAAPALPQQHDFRGGTITDEEHHWDMGDGVSQPMQRTIYLWHKPIRTVTEMKIRLTNTQGVLFDPAELVVFEDVVEIVSLAMTSIGLFGAYIVPEIGLAEPRIITSYTYGYQVSVTGETLEATDGTLFRAQDQWWDSTVAPKVYKNGVEITTGFTIDYDEGAVLFDVPPAAESTIKADYTTKLPRGIATATGILAAESLGEREMRSRGMGGLQGIRVGEIELQRVAQQRGGTTLVTPALAEAEQILSPFKFMWAGA